MKTVKLTCGRLCHARPRGTGNRRGQTEAARNNLGPLARVARVSHPISKERLRPTVTVLAEHGKQHISIDWSGKSGPTGIHPIEPIRAGISNGRCRPRLCENALT